MHMQSWDNRISTPVDLTQESLETMLTELSKFPYKLTLNFCCVVRFEIVGPYCPVHQPERPRYIHEIYPTDLDERQQWVSVLMTEWPPGSFPAAS